MTHRANIHRIVTEIRDAPSLAVMLDYDGTLVGIADTPELAIPDDELRSLLRAVAARPQTRLHIVSGRPREILELWLGDLDASLSAEHGLWYRKAPGDPWEAEMSVARDWIATVLPILEQFSAATPGSFVETKSASLAWHYRRAAPELGPRQAWALRRLLTETLCNRPLEVLDGKSVIEVRPLGVSKALVRHRILSKGGVFPTVVAIGDDRTDEDLFQALPEVSVTIAVGSGPTHARYRLPDHLAVRRLLEELLEED
jgi:trehalose 6-phosphate synthase/phosphatase